MPSLRRVRAVARKELRTLLRSPFSLFLAVALPVLTMVILSYGINVDVTRLPLGVVDADLSAESRRLVDAFTASGYFRLVTVATSPAALDAAMDAGRIRVGLVIPAAFAQSLHRGLPAEAQILVDGSLATRAEIARGYAAAVVAGFNQERLAAIAAANPVEGRRVQPDVDLATRVWFNPSLESKNFMVPGELVLSLLFWTPMLVSLTVTREKESGAILNVQTAPIARGEYVLGKLLPYSAVSFIAYGLLVLVSVFVFGVPVKGSLAVLTLGALLYVLAMTGLGLLVSMLVRTQVAALLAAVVIATAIGLFYSGWMEPLSMLNARGRVLGTLLPTAAFMTLTRGVFLKGLAFGAYGRTLLTLALYAAGYSLLATLVFRKRRR